MCSPLYRRAVGTLMAALAVFEVVMFALWVVAPAAQQQRHAGLLPGAVLDPEALFLPAYLFFLATLAGVRLAYSADRERVSVWALAVFIHVAEAGFWLLVAARGRPLASRDTLGALVRMVREGQPNSELLVAPLALAVLLLLAVPQSSHLNARHPRAAGGEQPSSRKKHGSDKDE